MIGRITSRPSIEQLQQRLLCELRCKAWRIVDALAASPANEKPVEIARDRPPVTTCVFHVGFVSIIESDDQLRRLRNEPVEHGRGPARSRLAKRIQSQFVTPIDATAARVAGGDDGR